MVGRHLPDRLPRPAPRESQQLLPSWVRVMVILTTIPVWSLVVLYSLIVLKDLPGAEWAIVPAAILTAVAPAWRIRRGGASDPGDDEPATEGAER